MPRTAVKHLTLRAILPLIVALTVLGVAAVVVLASVSQTAANKRQPRNFAITGSVSASLNPGRVQPINVVLRNGKAFPLWFKRLNVRLSVDAQHRAAGCSATRDFAVIQLPGSAFPFMLPAKSKAKRFRNRYGPVRTLKSLHVQSSPQLWFRNLPHVNQDGCKGAALTLHFSARAQDVKPPNVSVNKTPPGFAFDPRNPGQVTP
jgi:hypothetical protein